MKSPHSAEALYSFQVRLIQTDAQACVEAAVEHCGLDNPSLEEAAYALICNPMTPPVDSGYEILQGTHITMSGEGEHQDILATFNIRVLDPVKLQAEACARYRDCWGGNFNELDTTPPSVEQMLYEVLVASNASPSPCEAGYEIVAYRPTTPEADTAAELPASDLAP
jgi:hypothetical protein